jgi:hypothetical protein
MSTARGTPVYDTLVIVARFPDTEIWRGDDGGHRVHQEVGELRTHPRPGDSVVAFGLGSAAYPSPLAQASRYTPTEQEAGPPGSRPMPQWPPGEGSAQGGGHASGALGTGVPARPTSGWSRRPPASARASLQLSGAAHPPRCRGRFAPSTTRCGWPSTCCSARSASQQADAADKPSGKHVCLRPCS